MSPTNQSKPTSTDAIEKKRHEPASYSPTVGPPRGVLHIASGPGAAFFHQRLAPPIELAHWVQHYWYVQWDLRDAPPSNAETLPHPSCYLIFEHDLTQPVDHPSVHRCAEVSGVTTGKFSRIMQGHGRVFGLKFKPGGLHPFLQASVSTLTDRVVPAAQVFGPGILTLATQLRSLDTPETMGAAATAYFAERLPALDTNTCLSAQLVDTIFNDPAILTVESLAKHSGVSVRSLQRLFKQYVGTSPKWVIRRYRLHELLEHFHSGQPIDGARLALDLGYADQAHLINDFRNLAGFTPTEYLKRTHAPKTRTNSA
jgi:AraC-like DNA-binding protein